MMDQIIMAKLPQTKFYYLHKPSIKLSVLPFNNP